MNYYTLLPKHKFLNYVLRNSKTPAKLFTKQQVAQMLELAGHNEMAIEIMNDEREWYRTDMSDLVTEALELKTKHMITA